MTLSDLSFNSADLMLIRALFANPRVSAIELHQNFNMSIDQIVQLIQKLTANEVVQIERSTSSKEFFLKLTPRGRQWFLENESRLLQSNLQKKWRRVPQEFRPEQIGTKLDYEPGEQDVEEYFWRLEL